MNKKLIIIIAIVLVVVIGGGAAAFFMLSAKKEPAPVEVVYKEFELPEMYTNIKDQGKIVKLHITIEYTDATLLEELEKNKSKIINDVYEYFRGKDFATLSKPNGQERSRDEIKDIVAEILEDKGDKVSNVYFLEFIIQ